jgi:hypothetical protein
MRKDLEEMARMASVHVSHARNLCDLLSDGRPISNDTQALTNAAFIALLSQETLIEVLRYEIESRDGTTAKH